MVLRRKRIKTPHRKQTPQEFVRNIVWPIGEKREVIGAYLLAKLSQFAGCNLVVVFAILARVFACLRLCRVFLQLCNSLRKERDFCGVAQP